MLQYFVLRNDFFSMLKYIPLLFEVIMYSFKHKKHETVMNCKKVTLITTKVEEIDLYCEKQNYFACHSEPLLLIFAYSRAQVSASQC